MKEITCKYEDICQALKSRVQDVDVVLNENQESLIHMEDGTQSLFNIGMEILESLGYTSPPPIDEWTDYEYKKKTETCYVHDTYLK